VTDKPTFRRGEPDERRLSLIEAATRVLARERTPGASVRMIAGEAGVSPGLVTHYFPAIDSLMAAAYAHVVAQVEESVEEAVAAAGPDPRARLSAFVTANFGPKIAHPDLLGCWIAFWNLVRSRPEIAQQRIEQNAELRPRLEALLAACGLAKQEIGPAATAIGALVDGLWLELCLSPDQLSPEEASSIACRHLDLIVAAAV